MPGIHYEAVILGNLGNDWLKERNFHRFGLLTSVADQVDVGMLINHVVRRCAMSDVRVREHADTLKGLQSPVDRRQIDRFAVFSDVSADLLGRRVAQRRNRIGNHQALARYAKPSLAHAHFDITGGQRFLRTRRGEPSELTDG